MRIKIKGDQILKIGERFQISAKLRRKSITLNWARIKKLIINKFKRIRLVKNLISTYIWNILEIIIK